MAGDGFLFVDTGMDAKMRVELDPALHNGVQYAGFFDSAFPIRPYVQKAFQGANLTSAVKTYNSEMNSARESAEWSYQKNYALWPFMDFEKNQKAQRQATERDFEMYLFFTNCHTCCYGSETSAYFDCLPPPLEEYLGYQH